MLEVDFDWRGDPLGGQISDCKHCMTLEQLGLVDNIRSLPFDRAQISWRRLVWPSTRSMGTITTFSIN